MNRRYFGGPQPPNAEFTAREHQFPADPIDNSGRLSGTKETALARTSPGEPRTKFGVRCVYDSRPVSAYDANFSTATTTVEGGTNRVASFLVPSGYRFVAREVNIQFDTPPPVVLSTLQGFLTANGADVPNNSFFVGSGCTVKCFFVVEENSPFGIRISDLNGDISGNTVVQIYGNLLPITGVALPFEVTNREV